MTTWLSIEGSTFSVLVTFGADQIIARLFQYCLTQMKTSYHLILSVKRLINTYRVLLIMDTCMNLTQEPKTSLQENFNVNYSLQSLLQ
jgi:hypothetical protein